MTALNIIFGVVAFVVLLAFQVVWDRRHNNFRGVAFQVCGILSASALVTVLSHAVHHATLGITWWLYGFEFLIIVAYVLAWTRRRRKTASD